MSFIDPIPPGEPCCDCGIHKAVHIFAPDGLTGANHGNFRYLCECCLLTIQIDHAQKSADRLPRLLADLDGACHDA